MRLRQLLEKPGTRLARNVRNNNPGNIRISNNSWEGKTGNDGEFETFDSPEMGARAMARLLLNYQRKYGLNTVNDIINRYAPPSENDTNRYAKTVASKMGIGVNDEIDLLGNPALLRDMMTHMIGVEGGTSSLEYFTSDVIDNGIRLASGQKISQPATQTTTTTQKTTTQNNPQFSMWGNNTEYFKSKSDQEMTDLLSRFGIKK